MLTRPLMASEPNTQEASSASVRPPLRPVARMMARGPLAAKKKPARPLPMWAMPRSRQKPRGPEGASGSGAEGVEGVEWGSVTIKARIEGRRQGAGGGLGGRQH